MDKTALLGIVNSSLVCCIECYSFIDLVIFAA